MLIRTRRSLVVLSVVGVLLAGATSCGGDSKDGDNASTTLAGGTTVPASISEAPTESTAPSSGDTKVSDNPKLGRIVTTSDGFTLYTYKPDAGGGTATCTGACQGIWPPYPDAEHQVVEQGWPLYMYAGDPAAGDANGQGSGGVWFAMTPDGPSGP